VVLGRDPLGRFEPQALLATDLALRALEIVGSFVRRWQVEVTFAEARRRGRTPARTHAGTSGSSRSAHGVIEPSHAPHPSSSAAAPS